MSKRILQIKLDADDRRDLDAIKKSWDKVPWRVTYRAIVRSLIATEAENVKRMFSGGKKEQKK
jgi:hypothetical protein